MLSQIRQKKKKEAVRRLSQGSGAARDHSATVSQAPGQWPQRRKLSDQQQMQRQQPGIAGQRPAKRSHASPLDRDPTAIGNTTEPKLVKPAGTASFSFDTAQTSLSKETSQFTHTTTDTSSTVSVFGSGFSAPASSFQQSTGEASTATIPASTINVFGSGFGKSELNTDVSLSSASTSAPTNIFATVPQASSSSLLPSQGAKPVFGSGFSSRVASSSFDTSTASTGSSILFNLGAAVKQPSSASLTFGGFGNLGSSASAEVPSSNIFGNASGSETTGNNAAKPLTFGMAKPSFEVKSGATKPLFPTSQSSSATFGVSNVNKPQTGTTGIFGRAFAAATGVHKAKENKEKLAEEKIRGLETSTLTAVVIKDIPEAYNKNAWLRRFYSRFGEVTKVVCSAARKSATVVFKTHEAAELAKKKGKILRPGLPPVAIFWKQQGSRRSTTSESDQQTQPSPDIDKSISKRQLSPDKNRKVSKQAQSTEEQSAHSIKRLDVLKDVQQYKKSVQPSESAGEKLQVLEEIDKKLRHVFKRSSNITSAKAVVGTCKDMCPEKERYMREYQRRLSVFESVPGTGSVDENPQVDHTRAVKEYDRSAADKEDPLPHELRPVPVLKMTMDYLATNIMDQVEGREGEWFDFVWNRTRGIRKDITQQHLCDPGCVDLVEKTARFHIVCAHILCEADMNSFDAKINTENLTKCLQTLKQFYGDLYKDKGITCPQEAEFRAYDILLNLNEGDILREVMTFRDEVQKSAEVKFAMAVFHALNSNNFVRFFRLLRNANYLSACLLHRYFTQVRRRAVQTLNHSLSITNRTTSFQLKELVDILAFESDSEAGEFCTSHGLTVSDGCVNFARSSFIEPENRLPVKRAWRLIESKRNCSIGEVVYNGPLPPPPRHQPCLSFSEDGRYIGNTEELLSVFSQEEAPPSQAADQARRQPAFGVSTSAVPFPGRLTPKPDTSDGQVSVALTTSSGTVAGLTGAIGQSVQRPFTQAPQRAPKDTVVYSGEEIVNFTKKLFMEVMNEMYTEITKEALDKVHICLQLSSEITDSIHEQTVSEFIRETANSVLNEELNKKRIDEENAATQERVSNTIHRDFTEEFIFLECTRIVKEVIREVQEERLQRARERASKEICLSVIEEGVLDELQELAEEVLQEEKTERDAKLQQLACYVKRRRTARYFKRWLKSYRTSVHLKGLLSTFPPGAPMLSTEEQLQHLVGHRTQSITMASIRTDVQGREIHDVLTKRQSDLEDSRKHACRPLDVPSLLADSMRLQPVAGRLDPSSPVYWKLVISLPEGCNEFTGSEDKGLGMSFVIKEKFKRGVYPVHNNIPQGLKKKIDLLSLYRAEIRSIPTQCKVLKVCTKACYGVLTNTEVREAMDSQQFHGASAVMFVVDWKKLKLNPQAAREAHIRLRRVLESKPAEPRLSVAVILIDNEDITPTDDVFSLFDIHQLRIDGLLSECKICTVSSLGHLDHLSQKLSTAVTWLGRHAARSSLPRMDNLVNFIEDGLQREFTGPVSEDLFIRKQAKLEQQCPEAIIELYNSVLDHLGAVVSSKSLQRLSWPISEFTDNEKIDHGLPDVNWNSHENLQKLHSCITALKLPPPPPAAVDGTWESESELCLEYARSLSSNTTSLFNRVKWILARTKRVLDEINFLSLSPRLPASQVPWPLVLDACVNFRLMPLHSDPDLAEQDVYFLAEELNTFVQPSLWRQSANMSKEEAEKAKSENSLHSSKPRKTKDAKLHESFVDMEQQLNEITGTSHVNTTPLLQPTFQGTPSCSSTPEVTPLLVTPSIVTPIPVTTPVDVEPLSSSSNSAIQATSERLQAAVEEAKNESKRFEELLKSVLGDGDSPQSLGQSAWRKRKAQSLRESKKSPKFLEGLDVPDIDVSLGSLEESMSCFNETLKSQRRSDQFTERRLRECLES
ncbi:germinal-center associated nuclear protein-like isoform X2 [Oculina patagonica]